jgi:hypothetical protein
MERPVQRKLLLYLAVSAFGFIWLVLPRNAGVSVPLFMILQFCCLWVLLPDRKRLRFLFPVFILSLNSFLSANPIWRASDFLVAVALYSVMLLPFDWRDTSLRFLLRILKQVFEPIRYLHLPFVWILPPGPGRHLPRAAVLSSADLVFARGVDDFFQAIFDFINIDTVCRLLFGLLVGFYLFGLLCSAYGKTEAGTCQTGGKQGDPIVFTVLLAAILVLYTVFVAVQFKYLFAGAELPNGLTYTEYARKGFFEQLSLTGVNIALIWIAVQLTKEAGIRWTRPVKALCCYLCLITVILLVSSFYRMWLYCADDGLTRLRFLVFGFLIFELLGLLVTFFYIIRPGFNIVAVYLLIGLVYYLLLNLVPMDYFVAKSQVDRCLEGDSAGIAYTLTLSADAAPQIARLLYDDAVDEEIRSQAVDYLERNLTHDPSMPGRWQRFNLSLSQLERIDADGADRFLRSAS